VDYLNKSSSQLNAVAGNPMQAPLQINTADFQATIDILTNTHISGWIVLQGDPDVRVRVQVLVNMALRGEHVADGYRPDLEDAGLGSKDGRYAFNIDLGTYSRYFNNSINSVELRIGELNVPLFNGSLSFPFNPYAYQPQLDQTEPGILNIYTITFFDLAGNTYYSGGAERYLVDLVELCRNMGFQCKIVQASSGGAWRRYYKDIEVVGVPWNRSSILSLSNAFAAVAEPGSRAIFSPFILAAAFCPPGSIGISHGIFWDLDGNCYSQGENHVLLHSSLKHLDNLVSVDAATLNFLRGAAPAELTQTNAKVVINYVDGPAFDHAIAHNTSKPDDTIDRVRALRAQGKTVFVYPRRLYAARGLDILIGSARILLPVNDKLVILFVGRGDPADTQKVAKLAESYPEQVFHTWLEADDMPQAYDVADVVLVPTLHSEGTSLSCIEAMHCGKCVVVTHVGGLPELVIHRFNGLVIEPNMKSLLDAMKLLVGDPSLRTRLGDNARSVAASLNKGEWQNAWRDFLQRCYPDVEAALPEPAVPELLFYHPPVPGIEVNVMNQRPQALIRDLALMGAHTCFAQQPSTKLGAGQLPRRMELISENAEIFADHTVILCYYPYTLIACGDEFSKRLNAEDAKVFRQLRRKYAPHVAPQPRIFAKTVSFWFDYLDHKDIHPDEDARTLIELGLKYADLVTTSSLLLADAIRPVRPDIAYLGNAVSMDWLRAVAAVSSQNRAGDGVPILDADVLQDIIAWKRDGLRIGVYWGALADWNDVSFLSEPGQQVRYILVGPASDKGIRQTIAGSTVCTHIDYMAPDGLAQLARLADFALVPFRQNSVTQHVNPLKLWEYLALGLPVVARSTGELQAQFAAMSAAEQQRVILVPQGVTMDTAIQELVSAKLQKGLGLPPRTFASEIGPLFERVSKLTGHPQRLQITAADLPAWFAPATLQVAGVQVRPVPQYGPGSILLEIEAGQSIDVAPRWDLQLPAGASLSRATLRLRLNKDIALQKNVSLQLFGRIGSQYELIAQAQPTSSGEFRIELADGMAAFGQLSVQLRFAVKGDNARVKRHVLLHWEQFLLEFIN
jgi:glycosyltransferase involved in cell wall biosynthesis